MGAMGARHDHNNGWPLTYPAVELCKIDDGRNSLFYDLRYPLNDVPGNKPEANFKGRNRPFRKIKCAEMPLIFKKDELNEIEIGGSYNFDQLDEFLLDDHLKPVTVAGGSEFVSKLDPSQRKAVDGVFARRLSIICGGAGTGKSTSMRAVVEIAESNGLSTVLCAPTG